MIEICGVAFDVAHDFADGTAEREELDRYTKVTSSPEVCFVIEVQRGPVAAVLTLEQNNPGIIRTSEPDEVTISHPHYEVTLHPSMRRGRIIAGERFTPAAIRAALRVAVSCELPLRDSFFLHSSAVCHPSGVNLAFYGPSGAGKSTIASLSPWVVAGEELLLVSRRDGRFHISGTRFDPRQNLAPSRPIAALIRLEKGTTYELNPLSASEAIRNLIAVTMVPRLTRLWTRALVLLAEISQTIPCYTMKWSKDAPPWPELDASLFLR